MESFLQELEPPVVPSGLEITEPATGEIQEQDGDSPHQVKKRKAPDITVWCFGIAHGVVGEEPRANESQPDFRNYERQCVDQRNMQHIIEEGHTSKNGDHA